jgi:hypothetical protein
MMVKLDGSDELNLTHSDFDEVDPAWAPDRTKIAFAGVRFEFTVDPITGERGIQVGAVSLTKHRLSSSRSP